MSRKVTNQNKQSFNTLWKKITVKNVKSGIIAIPLCKAEEEAKCRIILPKSEELKYMT